MADQSRLKNSSHPRMDGARLRRILPLAWALLASAVALGILFVAFRDLDFDRLIRVLVASEWGWVGVLAVSIPLEQVVRGWKWRQLLYDIRPIGTLRLFGAVMAGYFANMVVPVGISPLVRAWLVAKIERLGVMTVLMTTALERFVDGIVFAVMVGILVYFASLPRTEGDLRFALVAAGLGALTLFAALIAALFLAKRHLNETGSFVTRSIARLERVRGGRLAGLGDSIAAGILWPRSRARGAAVIAASALMKAISTTHFLWASLAVGIALAPFDYLFLVIFAGFSLIIARFIRIPGGFVIGSVFAMKLLGVPDEEALTMVLLVHFVSILMTVAIGAIALCRSGVAIGEMRRGLRADNDPNR